MAVQDEIPKSRLTLRYRTEINGEPANMELPLRLLVLGDFSQGTSKDRKIDLEERRVRALDGTNTAGIMSDMGLSLNIDVPNKVDPENGESTAVALKFTSMRSFNPAEIAKQMPKVRGLLLLKQLLQEADSNVANTKNFRNMLADLYKDPAAYKKVVEELKGFESFKVPKGGAAAAK